MGNDSPEHRRGRKGPARTFSPAPACRWPQIEILGEVDGSVGIVLWESVRALWDWIQDREAGETSGTQPRRQLPTTWGYARIEAPELAEAIGAIAALRTAPLLATPATLATAARHVARWAEDRALPETAIQFAEAAAALQPNEPESANLSGRMCRRAGELARAAQWYDRAIGLARQSRNRREWTYANLGAGTTAYRQGRARDARRHFLSVAWKTRDSGHKAAAAKSQHDLMLISAEAGDLADALEHARRAFDWYPKHHRRLPYFAHDVAFLAILGGAPTVAVRLLQGVMERLTLPHEQLLVWGTLARAAADDGNPELFKRARRHVTRSAPLYLEHAAPALANTAIGAARLGNVRHAERYARAAKQIARTRGLREPEKVAQELIERLARGEAPAPPHPELVHQKELRDLAEELAQQLARWRGPTWRPRHASESADRSGSVP